MITRTRRTSLLLGALLAAAAAYIAHAPPVEAASTRFECEHQVCDGASYCMYMIDKHCSVSESGRECTASTCVVE
jgi:hypothetical protein